MNKKTNLQQKRLINPRLVLWKTSLVFSKAKIMTWQSHYQTYTEGLECLCPPKDMSKNFIHTTQNLQTAPVPTLEEWKNKLVCYWYIVQSYNGYWKQNRKPLIYAAARMNLKGIVLSKESQTQQYLLYSTIYMKVKNRQKLTFADGSSEVPTGTRYSHITQPVPCPGTHPTELVHVCAKKTHKKMFRTALPVIALTEINLNLHTLKNK